MVNVFHYIHVQSKAHLQIKSSEKIQKNYNNESLCPFLSMLLAKSSRLINAFRPSPQVFKTDDKSHIRATYVLSP